MTSLGQPSDTAELCGVCRPTSYKAQKPGEFFAAALSVSSGRYDTEFLDKAQFQ
jgi:hypothetical protein